jgi:N-acetylmuramoyl-L-alanine amidase
MRNINFIVIHEADTPLLKPSGDQFTVMDIDQWHAERGFQRQSNWRNHFNPNLRSCGYQYVIGVMGDIWTGRHEDELPAAVAGHNAESINICLIGKGKYTRAQWTALALLVEQLRDRHRSAAIVGHCDFPGVQKTCPDFDVRQWVADYFEPPEGHLEDL